jgi:hypothetical protein
MVAVGYRLSAFTFVRAIANEDLFGLDPAMVGEHLEQLLRLRTRTLATVTDTARRFDCRCSTMTSPAPDSDREPKCWRRQSFAAPFSALY